MTDDKSAGPPRKIESAVRTPDGWRFKLACRHVLERRLGSSQKWLRCGKCRPHATADGTARSFGIAEEAREAGRLRDEGREVSVMPANHPFDLLVDGDRVDVKAAHLGPKGYLFSAMKGGECCDWFALVCVGADGEPAARFHVPASEVPGDRIIIRGLALRGYGKYGRFFVTQPRHQDTEPSHFGESNPGPTVYEIAGGPSDSGGLAESVSRARRSGSE